MTETTSARVIISEILRNMETSCEELYSHVVVPSFYQVCLHAADFDRLEPILPRVVADAKTALADHLVDLNRVRLVDRLVSEKPHRYEPADREWRVELFRDPDGDQLAGTVKVTSQLLLPPRQGVGGGSVTRFSVTRSDDQDKEAGGSARTPVSAPETATVRAELCYWNAGVPRKARMSKSEFLIGRGGPANPVDLVIAHPSVSEIHIRIHQVETSGTFFLENLGKYGTTVDGVDVPKGTEVRLGRTATIGLASDSALVEFQVGERL